ncbi:MAG: hypothetical protein ACRELT_12160, partial [Longimicrobiales bacterium]
MKRVPLIELVTPADEDEAAVRGAAILTRGDVLHLRLPASEMSRRDRMARAEAALNEVVRVLKARHGLPSAAYVELDEESFGTPVAPFHKGRFLLPHQDGGHSSFLTPSRLDRPELSADERVFSRSVYWKRPSHKMFQGFMVTSTGQPPGITHYYNLLAPVWDAFVRARGAEPADIPELASFVLQNLRWSREQQHVHGSRYFTLGALLGSRELAHHVMPSGPRAESELWPEQYANVPALCAMADTCACGLCRGPGER